MPLRSSDPFFSFAQGDIDLAQGALLIAREARPDLDGSHYLHVLDQWADDFAAQTMGRSAAEAIDPFSTYVFEELGFRGNQEAYDDPQNSYIDAVIDRRIGIPITLSLVYIESGRRLGLPLSGVNFPYHFLVRCDAPPEQIFIDPFAGGQRLDRQQLAERLPVVDGAQLRFSEQYVEPASPRDILARMLRNLKRIHVTERRLRDAVRCGERISWLLPNEAENYRDLGFLYYRAHEYGKSIAAFEEYLRWADEPHDVEEIRQNIRVISGRLGLLN